VTAVRKRENITTQNHIPEISYYDAMMYVRSFMVFYLYVAFLRASLDHRRLYRLVTLYYIVYTGIRPPSDTSACALDGGKIPHTILISLAGVLPLYVKITKGVSFVRLNPRNLQNIFDISV
jgi:hypothetical protein